MQTDQTLQDLISRIEYKDWNIVLRWDKERPYLQIQFDAPDCFTGEVERQFCRKWFLSMWMPDSEVVRTAFHAIKQAVLHEAEEDFRFDGEPVYRPHFDVYALHEISRMNRIDKRE